jgi:hypothetical protein
LETDVTSTSSVVEWEVGIHKVGRDLRTESVVYIFIGLACLVFAALSETLLIAITVLLGCIAFIPELRSSFHPKYFVSSVTADTTGIAFKLFHSQHFYAKWNSLTLEAPWANVLSMEIVPDFAGEADSSVDVVFHLSGQSIVGQRVAVDANSREIAQGYVDAMRRLKEFVDLSPPMDDHVVN